MTSVAILPDGTPQNGSRCLAVAGPFHSEGRTAGEALDALTAQLDESQTGTLVIVQSFRGDSEFATADQERLAGLMSKWRQARDAGVALPSDEQRELEALVQAELEAAGRRAELLRQNLQP